MNGTCDMEMGGMEMGGMMLGMVSWGLLASPCWSWPSSQRSGSPRRMNATGGGGPDPRVAEDILRRRYAAGELDEDEYLIEQAGLRDPASHSPPPLARVDLTAIRRRGPVNGGVADGSWRTRLDYYVE